MDHLSLTFSALADPTRRAILARLAEGETTVTELAAPFEMTLPAVTKHLKVLERAGLVIRGREAQWRPCRLEAKPLQEAVSWIEQYRQFWEERLDRLEDYLRELQLQEQAHEEARAIAKKKAVKKPVAKAQKDGKNRKEAATATVQNGQSGKAASKMRARKNPRTGTSKD
jgi:DNA-binding transcriptional ArsR family regulator